MKTISDVVRPATPGENAELCLRIQKGDMAAADELVERNLPFVISITHQHGVYPDHSEYEDCLSIGGQALIVAARRFNPNRGANYATYAAWWIKQAIKRYLNNNQNTIRIPIHVGQARNRLTRAAQSLECRLGRRPTMQEISSASGIDLDTIGKLYNLPTTSALDRSLGEDGEETMHGLIPDTNTVVADTAAANHDDYVQAVRKIRQLIIIAGSTGGNRAPDRNRIVFCERYGLEGYGPPRSLEGVGAMHGITRERVRQLCEKVFRTASYPWVKIRYPDSICSEAELLATIDFILRVGENLWTMTGMKPEGFDLVSMKEVKPDHHLDQLPEQSERVSELVQGIIESLVTAFAEEDIDAETLFDTHSGKHHAERDALLYALTCDLGIPVTDFQELVSDTLVSRLGKLLDNPDPLSARAKKALEALRAEYTLSMWGKPSLLMERQTSLYGKQRAELEAFLGQPNGSSPEEIDAARALLDQ